MRFEIIVKNARNILVVHPETDIELAVLSDLCRAGSDLGAVLPAAFPNLSVQIGDPEPPE